MLNPTIWFGLSSYVVGYEMNKQERPNQMFGPNIYILQFHTVLYTVVIANLLYFNHDLLQQHPFYSQVKTPKG
jgi:hypothetical protein